MTWGPFGGPLFPKEKLMKDFIQFAAILLLIFGLIAAVPIMGITIGIGFGAWFLWKAWQEERDVNRS